MSSKATLVASCTIGGSFTSIECDAEPPYEVLLQPDHPCATNGINFNFYEKARCLSCTVHYTKLVVSDRTVATSRRPSAVVSDAVSGVYINVWFLNNQDFLEVVEINGTTATCSCVEDVNRDLIELPLDLVADLVARFGNNQSIILKLNFTNMVYPVVLGLRRTYLPFKLSIVNLLLLAAQEERCKTFCHFHRYHVLLSEKFA
jgi:hypothetical protein